MMKSRLQHLQGRAVGIDDGVQSVVFGKVEISDNGNLITWGEADQEQHIGRIWKDDVVKHEQLEGLEGIAEDTITLRNGSHVKFGLMD
jgi:hypothetical protein